MNRKSPFRRLGHRLPSPALVIACLALAVSLSGIGYATVVLPRNSVGTSQLKNNAVLSSKVKDRTLKAVDFARGQLRAGPAGAAGPAGPTGPAGPSTGPAGGDLAGTYPNPTIGNGAVSQAKLAAAEAWHEVGTAGNPNFSSPYIFGCPTTPLWQNSVNYDNTAAFYRDPYGIVHLKGVVKNGVIGCAIFFLPQGYRPGEGYAGYSENQPVISNGAIGQVWIIGNAPDSASGAVIAWVGSSTSFSLDGVSFRCGPRGSYGCP